MILPATTLVLLTEILTAHLPGTATIVQKVASHPLQASVSGIITDHLSGRGSAARSVSVCLSVCVSACVCMCGGQLLN